MPSLPDLLYTCSTCNGTGVVPDDKEGVKTCPKCHGAGKFLTANGEKMREFLLFVLKEDAFEAGV